MNEEVNFSLRKEWNIVINYSFHSFQNGFQLKDMLSFVKLLEQVEIHSFTFREISYMLDLISKVLKIFDLIIVNALLNVSNSL